MQHWVPTFLTHPMPTASPSLHGWSSAPHCSRTPVCRHPHHCQPRHSTVMPCSPPSPPLGTTVGWGLGLHGSRVVVLGQPPLRSGPSMAAGFLLPAGLEWEEERGGCPRCGVSRALRRKSVGRRSSAERGCEKWAWLQGTGGGGAGCAVPCLRERVSTSGDIRGPTCCRDVRVASCSWCSRAGRWWGDAAAGP